MLYKKQGFPEESEIVMCKVTNVQYNSVFVNLLEFDLPGMIDISEVSPGRIRNIRDFVKEGKIITCKVLRVREALRQIDLSLRRVTDYQRREKANEIKQQQLAESIVTFVATRVKKESKDIFFAIWDQVKHEYANMYHFFEAISENHELIKTLKVSKEEQEQLLQLITQRIKQREVSISGKISLKSYAPNGVDVVKKVLGEGEEGAKTDLHLRYAGSGKYNFSITAKDYKIAEKSFDGMKSAIEASIKKQDVEFSISRVKS